MPRRIDITREDAAATTSLVSREDVAANDVARKVV
jgi:hypothetical protein